MFSTTYIPEQCKTTKRSPAVADTADRTA